MKNEDAIRMVNKATYEVLAETQPEAVEIIKQWFREGQSAENMKSLVFLFGVKYDSISVFAVVCSIDYLNEHPEVWMEGQ